jgi:hypothetical protein
MNHEDGGGDHRSAGGNGRVPEYVPHEMLADVHRSHGDPNTMMPAHAATQNVGRAATARS